jgi:hypothetical protein
MLPRLAAMLLLAAAACFGPQPVTGLPCAPPGSDPRCPSGQVCVLVDGIEACDTGPGADIDAGQIDSLVSQADARIDGSPGVDSDGDGVADSDDNCPDDPNLDQADEDADGTGDVCDGCPPFTETADMDGDGVEGPCDPDPGTPGNAIVAFAGFASGLPAGWTATSGVLAIGGAAEFASSVSEQSLVMPAPAGIARIDVLAAATPTSFNATLGGIGVVQRRPGSGDLGITCQLVATSSGSPQELRLFDLEAGGTVVAAPHDVDLDVTYLLANRRDGNGYRCSASDPSEEVSGSSTYSPTVPRLGLRTRNAGARYAWVLVVSRP